MKTKKMKHLLTILMSLVSLTASAYDIEVNGIYYNVTSLSDLTMSVTYGEKMYEGTIVIPPTIQYNNRTLTVTEIEKDAFSRYGWNSNKVNAIRSLTIPNTISSLPMDVLYYCTSLDSLIIQDGETEIDLGRQNEHIFNNSKDYYQGPLYNTPTSYVYVGRNIKKIRYQSGSYYSYYYDQFYNSQLQVAEIGDKVTSMPFFYQSKKLENVIGGKGIVETGDSIFFGCSALKSVSLPNAQTIGSYAFGSCFALESASLPNAQTIGSNAFISCSALESVSIPNAQTIEHGAFAYCFALESVSIPNAQTIGSAAFEDCSALTQIALPQSVENIGSRAFYGTKITDIIIPNKIKKIYDIFPTCIKSITLGDSIESIISSAFKCDGLEIINIYTPTPPALDENACRNAQYISVTVNVPIGSKEAYIQADVWKNFWGINDVLSTGIESIADCSSELAFVSASDGIALSGADGQSVNVYRVTGEKVLSIKNYQRQSLSLPKGIYVIKAGKKSLKVQL